MKNTHKLFKTFSIATLSFAALNVQAAELKTGLNGSGELGFADTTGNTQSTSLFGALKLNYLQESYELKSKFETSYKSENGTETEERYLADLQANRFYDTNRTFYSFIGLRFEKDHFSGIELDSTLSLGLGKELYKTQQTKFTGEVGVAQQHIEYTKAYGNSSDSQLAGRVKLDLTHKINDQVVFLQDVVYVAGNEQKTLESNTGFKVKVADNMNLKASYKYRHNDSPAKGAKKTDTQTLLTLIYDF